MKPSTITIDGPAAAGKSALGERLARHLGYLYFDTGVLYSEARSTDVESNRVSLTLMQKQINLTTPDAYNPFNGGCLGDPGDARNR